MILHFYILAESSFGRKNYIGLDGSATADNLIGQWPKRYLAKSSGTLSFTSTVKQTKRKTNASTDRQR